jgi:hypothetical protein
MTRAQLFFAAHNGHTYPEKFSDVDAYLAYAEVQPNGDWIFPDGSALRAEVSRFERWSDHRPVIRLVPIK